MRVHPATASPEPWTGKIMDTCQEVLGVWMDMVIGLFGSLIECDIFRPVVENAPVVGRQ